MTEHFAVLDTPIGELGLLASQRGLRRVAFAHEIAELLAANPGAVHDDSGLVLSTAIAQLREYFAAERRQFSVPLDRPEPATFLTRVHRLIAEIPYGQTTSYGELAAAAGSPRAARAVGGACGKNPLPIVVPCHRVLSSDGRIGGYGRGFLGGLEVKEKLLGLEGVRL